MSSPASADDQAPLLSHEEFLAQESLEAMLALYRERGFSGERAACLLRASQDWGRVALAKAEEVQDPPERFEPAICQRGGVQFAVYGMFHGMIGGGDKEYKEFINTPLRALELTLFENALGYFYPSQVAVNIPDFVVLDVAESISLGLYVGLRFPLLVWELISESLKLGYRRGEGVAAFEFSPRYHAIDLETRRALDELPLLPSRLEIDYEMAEWEARTFWSTLRESYTLVPRSMFMAGFAVGYAESRGLNEVSLVVGDLHTAEIVRFLEDPDTAHPLFLDAQAWGRRSNFSRGLRSALAKGFHLTVSGMMGVTLLLPQIVILYMLYLFLTR